MEPGISDETVLDMANREEAVLLTVDKDFGELVFRQGRMTGGIILTPAAADPPPLALRRTAELFSLGRQS